MTRFAELRPDGLVVSVGEGPGDWEPTIYRWAWVPDGLKVAPGWNFKDGAWTPPKP